MFRRRSGRALAAIALLVGLAGFSSAPAAARIRPIPPTPQPPHSIVRGPHDEGVPLLMYHVLNVPPPGAPFPELYVRPSDFAGQMAWLARHGYHAVTLDRVYDYWSRGWALPRRPVVVTFDDGYLTDYTVGMRVLLRHHWPGVLNLEVRNMRSPTGMPAWRVRNLVAAGWEIDAHTITHPDLTTLGAAQLWHEVDGSRRIISREFQVPVDFFCYPDGRYDPAVIAAVKRAGYVGATTTNYGLARPNGLFTLDRIRIDGTDGVAGFASKLDDVRG